MLQILSFLWPYLILSSPLLAFFLGLLATFRVLRLQETFKSSKVAVFVVLIFLANFLSTGFSGALSIGVLTNLVINFLVTYIVAYLFARNYFKIEQKKAIYFGLYFIGISFLIYLALTTMLFALFGVVSQGFFKQFQTK